ncbi:histidine phosphatase family protein [Deinococcus fonticola]|uniref:histidine phosphatase family protein n=1 Tax=Deinococcus fonticola TaxID=2528713 RepID=UPI001F10597A|nr:histidine phosphatase family protein [Deinococcus fonticola]
MMPEPELAPPDAKHPTPKSRPASLILVRHGQTAYNAERRWQGHLDAPLDDTGREQARRLAAHLRAQGISGPVIHASDLSRAYATAEALFTALGGTLHAQAALREIHVGDWEGRLYDDVAAVHPELSRRFWNGDPHAGAPGGETPAQVARRMHEFALAHWPRAGESVILVSHGVAITGLLATLLNLDYGASWASRTTEHRNTAYSVLQVDPITRETLAVDIARTDHLHLASAAP